MGKIRLDLSAIESSLRAVQQDFAHINAIIETPRDTLSDQVLDNLMSGYERLDRLAADGVDPFALGNSPELLNLNHLVLCGAGDWDDADECAPHRSETERRFYDERSGGGIGALMGFMDDHRDDPVWRRAAGAYVHILSQPQLFIEGNHRTGALIMSAILMRQGRPPFVLTVDNAKAYFDPSSLVKACKKRTIRMLVEVPKLRKRLAALLKDTADPRYLR